MYAYSWRISVLILLIIFSCNSENNEIKYDDILNLDHIDNLHSVVTINDTLQIGTIAIYADHPDYHPVTASGEGYTCIDDVARTIVLYSDKDILKSEKDAYQKLEHWIGFVIYMQSENAYFYNFLNDDQSINKTGQTSVNRPDWWSWRALWSLEEAYPFIKKKNHQLATEIQHTSNRLVEVLLKDFVSLEENELEMEGLSVPGWLPGGTAADQAAVLLLGLELYYGRTQDQEVKSLMEKLARGIMLMQHGDEKQWPYGAFFSWKNIWHAYGNIQAYALLKTGERLNNKSMKESALKEVDHFYDFVIKEGFLNYFTAEKIDSNYGLKEKQQFPQIAYGIRPMVYACLEAYSLTGDDEYVLRAIKLASWLFGKNEAGINMYDPASGRCYDGLESADKFNKNSGAESTIEALLTIQAFQKYGIKPQYFHKILKEYTK